MHRYLQVLTATLKSFAHLAETTVFAYMGVDLFAMSGAGVAAFSAASGRPSLDAGSLDLTGS